VPECKDRGWKDSERIQDHSQNVEGGIFSPTKDEGRHNEGHRAPNDANRQDKSKVKLPQF
jgi:hypothetical protein